MNDDTVRECVQLLKDRFVRWRNPPVDLPADSVIEGVVRAVVQTALLRSTGYTMTPLEMIAEWRKGCSCASPGKPEECPACTVGLIEAIEGALTAPRAEPEIDDATIARIVAAAVRDNVTAHGDTVTGSWAGSLAKRMTNQLRGHLSAAARKGAA